MFHIDAYIVVLKLSNQEISEPFPRLRADLKDNFLHRRLHRLDVIMTKFDIVLYCFVTLTPWMDCHEWGPT